MKSNEPNIVFWSLRICSLGMIRMKICSAEWSRLCGGLILNGETQLCLTPREQKSRALFYLCPTSRTSRLKTHISVIVLFECTLLPLIYVPVPLCMFTCLYSVSLCHHQRFYITLSSFYIKLFNICSIY